MKRTHCVAFESKAKADEAKGKGKGEPPNDANGRGKGKVDGEQMEPLAVCFWCPAQGRWHHRDSWMADAAQQHRLNEE